MADDKTFRPKRKNIDPSEVAEVTGEESLQRIQSIKSAAAKEEAEIQRNRDEVEENVGFELPPGPQVTGNIPEMFKQAVSQQQQRGQQQHSQQQQRGPKVRQRPNDEMRLTGSSRLEELILGTRAIYEPIDLPSCGNFYDGINGPTDGVLYVRPMTGEEEQILATPRFIKKGQAINMIFDKCIRGEYESKNFLAQDRTYLLIYLRGISYTPAYEVEVKCPYTDRTFATIIDLNSLLVDECPESFGPESLKGTLPTTGYKFTYRLSTGLDEQNIQDYRDMRIKEFDLSNQADDTLLYRTALLIENMEGLINTKEIQTLLKKMPIGDVSYLRNIITEPPFGVDTTVSLISPYTTEEFQIDLPLESGFFFPRAKKTPTQA